MQLYLQGFGYLVKASHACAKLLCHFLEDLLLLTFPFALSLHAEAVWSVLWHPPLIPEGCRGGELWEASVWAILPCCILWAGKLTHVLLSSWILGFQPVLSNLLYFRAAKTGKQSAGNHGVKSASWVKLSGGLYSEGRSLSCICANCYIGFRGAVENKHLHQI